MDARPLPRSAPKRLRIPSIGVDAAMLEVGTTARGGIGTPSMARAQLAAWYRDGPAPAERGSAVLVGHVDTTGERAVFFRLNALRPGDRIHISRADGSTGTFAVDSHQYVSKRDFPADRVLRNTGRAELRLITCAPPFDKKRREYLNNLIVYAHLIDGSRSAEQRR